MKPGGSWGGLFTRATAFFMSVKPEEKPQESKKLTADHFTSQAVKAINALNDEWYNVNTGIWDDAWWNSGNALTTLAEFAKLRPEAANKINIGGYLHNTFLQAQNTQVTTLKNVDDLGMVASVNTMGAPGKTVAQKHKAQDAEELRQQWGKNTWENLKKRNFANFINDFYDDEGWWALGLIRSFDATGNQDFLDDAVIIFDDMRTGLGGPCGGGLYWSKERKYVNAITNELYLAVAASLANRIPSDPRYLDIAHDQWKWFRSSGMINSKSLINDGLTGQCKNNGMQTWSYNQGVILGGLVELDRALRARHGKTEAGLLRTAGKIAHAAMDHLANADGILVETDKCETRRGNCGRDGQQFKGIFIRNLRYLHEAAPSPKYRRFILDQAVSIWENNRDAKNRLGVAWAGPFVKATGPSQSSALDALVAAIAVA